MGSEWEGRIQSTLENVYATVFVYFECMLVGSAICGLHAARHQPAPDKDFIVILGCWFRHDGTLPPLLKGRADRALEFARMMTARAPLALSFIKHAANVALDVDIRDGFRMCEWAQLSLARTQDKEEGVKAFMEKRKPAFTGK